MESEKLALLIPIIAIIMGIGIGMLAIYTGYLKRKDLFAHYHQERMAAIEKGIDCPPWPNHALANDETPAPPRRHLLTGLVWLFIGLGAMVAVYATFDLSRALFGLIPVGIGLAHLIYYFVEGRRKQKRWSKPRQPAGPEPVASEVISVPRRTKRGIRPTDSLFICVHQWCCSVRGAPRAQSPQPNTAETRGRSPPRRR